VKKNKNKVKGGAVVHSIMFSFPLLVNFQPFNIVDSQGFSQKGKRIRISLYLALLPSIYESIVKGCQLIILFLGSYACYVTN